MISKLVHKYKSINPTIKTSLWFLFANIFQKAVMVIFTPIFTRMLTTEQFSKYAVFQSWETIFTVFATLSITNYATAKALVEFKDDKDGFVTSSEFLTFILTVFCFGIYFLGRAVFGFFDDMPLWIMILMFVDIFSVACFGFWSQRERFDGKYKALTVVSIISGMLAPGIAFALIIFSDYIGIDKSWARIIGLVASNGIIGIFLLYTSIKRSKLFFSAKYWKYCFSYCIPLIPHFLAAAFLQKIGQLFVDNYCGVEISGIYALANSLAMLMMVVNDAFTKTLVPWTYQKLAMEKYKEISKPINVALAVIGLGDIMMALLAPELVYIFADREYTKAIYAIPPLVAVCFFAFLYNTFANIEYYYKETKMISLASIIAGITIVAANAVFVPLFGFRGAAYASMISFMIYALMHYLFMEKTLRKHLNGCKVYDTGFILKLSIIFALIILFIPMIYGLPIIRYIIIILMFIILMFNYKSILSIFGKSEGL